MNGLYQPEQTEAKAMTTSVLVVEDDSVHESHSLRRVLELAVESTRREQEKIGIALDSCHLDDLAEVSQFGGTEPAEVKSICQGVSSNEPTRALP